MSQKKEDVYKHKKLYRRKERMKKIIRLGAIIFCIVIVIFNTNVQAYTVDTEARASIVFDQKLPYHYEAEEKGNYKILSYKNGTILYFLERNQTSVMTRFTNVEKQKDDVLERILENGYPTKTQQELGVVTQNEAHFATQEAIYAYLEHKDMNRYIAENEEGQRIINCAANILEKAKKEEVIIKEIDEDWKPDETDGNKRYKQYSITLSPKINEVKIIVENGENVIITNDQNQPITTARNGDIIKMIVPKGMNQQFQVKLLYEKQGNGIYKIYNTANTNLQYLLSVDENVTKEKEMDINFQNLASVTICNHTYEGKGPIEGSKFSILNYSNVPIKEDLVTDENGRIHTFLEQGKYYLKQTTVKEGYSLAEELIGFEIKKLEDVTLTVSNAKQTTEEIKSETTRNQYCTRKQKNNRNGCR